MKSLYKFQLSALLLILAAYSSTAHANNNEIKVLIQHGHYIEAIEKLKADEDLSKSWQSNFWLGTAYLLNGQLDQAAIALDYALSLQGEVADIWIQRAIVEQERGNYAPSLQLLNVALQLNNKSADTYLNAAYAYEHQGNIRAARDAYGTYLRLSAQSPHAGFSRQQVLARLMKLPSGIHEKKVRISASE